MPTKISCEGQGCKMKQMICKCRNCWTFKNVPRDCVKMCKVSDDLWNTAEILKAKQIYLTPLNKTEERSGTFDSRRNFWNSKSEKKNRWCKTHSNTKTDFIVGFWRWNSPALISIKLNCLLFQTWILISDALGVINPCGSLRKMNWLVDWPWEFQWKMMKIQIVQLCCTVSLT